MPFRKEATFFVSRAIFSAIKRIYLLAEDPKVLLHLSISQPSYKKCTNSISLVFVYHLTRSRTHNINRARSLSRALKLP